MKVDKRKQPRSEQEAYAHAHGFFWLPCPLCLEPFGGHEDQKERGRVQYAQSMGATVCINCTQKAETINKVNRDWIPTVNNPKYDANKTEAVNKTVYDALVVKAIKRGRDLIQAGKTESATELKIGNCLFCNKPINHETHHRVNDKRDHAFVDPEPSPTKL